MAIRFFDMFSGIGGFRSGLEAIGGFECVGHCEIDKQANQAYCAIYDVKQEEVYFNDATKIDPKDVPDIDLICAGFPCQSFSIAGRRRGFDDVRGTLFFEIARIASYKKPAYMLLENVPGLLSSMSFQNWGMMSAGRCLTARISAFLNPEKECTLSAILERNAPPKYFLSTTQMERLLYKSYQVEKETECTVPSESESP